MIPRLEHTDPFFRLKRCAGTGLCLAAAAGLLCVGAATVADPHEWTAAVPTVWPLPEPIRTAFEDHRTILKPERDEAEWWAGAPSVVRDDV
jgi:hypothetical protein